MSDCGESSSNNAKKKIYTVDGRKCSATWYHKVRKRRRLEAEIQNDNENKQVHITLESSNFPNTAYEN